MVRRFKNQLLSGLSQAKGPGSRVSYWVTVTVFSLTGTGLFAKGTQDIDAHELQARQASINRFKDFMQDKNIQTLPKGPDGKPVTGTTKHNANKDDKNPFESDLTYHDAVTEKIVTVADPSKPNDPNAAKIERQKAFKSPHGKLSASGGSSALERKSEEVDERFKKEDEKQQKKTEEGVTYDGMFKDTIKEVREKDIQTGKKANAKDPKQDLKPKDPSNPKDPEDDFTVVSRKEIREEAIKDFSDVGTNSAQTIIEAARDPQKKNDSQQLANGVLLRVAAAENLMALWRSTLANLTQRRAAKAIPPLSGGAGVGKIDMDEDVPNCQDWSKKAAEKIGQVKDKELKENLEKDLKAMTSQCEEIASLPYNAISPKYVVEENSDKYKLSIEGAKEEDGIERDSRAQLEIMARAGKSATEVESNWKFDTKDDLVTRKQYQADGTAKEISISAAQDIESFNNQLRSAKKGYEEAAKRLGNFKAPDPTQYEIAPESESMMSISQAPPAAMEEYGVEGRGSLLETAPQAYDQLQNPPR